MCDTLGFINDKGAFFAKNSDRSPNEPQLLEYYPRQLQSERTVQTTYMVVPQAKETHAVLLSRPSWMWGAEMGVNDCGVCIGNEAVFTRGAYCKDEALTGMDMLRIALERSNDAKTASYILICLLKQYDQGGNCGYDHEFYYDNSFLVMDRNEVYVLETAGKEWVRKKTDRASISNRLTIGTDGDIYSGKKTVDFKGSNTEPVYTLFSGSKSRLGQTREVLKTASGPADCMKALRTHKPGISDPLAAGTVDSVCMHFGGLVGDHTTSSMVVNLGEDRTVVWATGTSTPCISLYKPWLFGTEPVRPVFAAEDEAAEKYWRDAERFRRSIIGKTLPADYYSERDEIEKAWLACAETVANEDFTGFSKRCAAEEKAFFNRWSGEKLDAAGAGSAFMSRWSRKNKVFEEES